MEASGHNIIFPSKDRAWQIVLYSIILGIIGDFQAASIIGGIINQTGIILVKQPSHINELPVVDLEACKLVLLVQPSSAACSWMSVFTSIYREIISSHGKIRHWKITYIGYICATIYQPGLNSYYNNYIHFVHSFTVLFFSFQHDWE